MGGDYDAGERFDLRLPYAEQGYVDEDADAMGKLMNIFGMGKNNQASAKQQEGEEDPGLVDEEEAASTKGPWPWSQ